MVASAPLLVKTGGVEVDTPGEGFVDITRPVQDWLAEAQACDGLCTLFLRHTSASLTIQENADPDVRRDLLDALRRFAPEDHPYRHDLEGPDDMPAHIRTMLTATSVTIPVSDGQMVLGTWQALYLIEHRAAPHRRSVAMTFLGSVALEA
ncbi:secondary thiamine-phosphate synthase enzyme YjbQ [Terrihabitans sp. B22-R8]|uniref:secondary thiamine-phosphate synthase enzyme YjbQ n=1 Tax=Terrihabitans sp. B22-R8 TaxID=3425128 RepID=UPI00403CAFAB